MTYSCSDFVDDILEELGITVPEEARDDPSVQADLALAAIRKLSGRADGMGRLTQQQFEEMMCLLRASRALIEETRVGGLDMEAKVALRQRAKELREQALLIGK